MKYFFILYILLIGNLSYAQTEQSVEGNPNNLPIREYKLEIDQKMVNKAGKKVMGMTVNGTIPGPVLEFNEGEYAVIHVKNNMEVETSIHWHGMLLPNFFDGVPYLTTPPIQPGESFTYEFDIKQAGTYWYHSHTMLQKQSGVFGSIMIHPKEKDFDYDKDLVLMLSDWTNEDPHNVLRNLKRGTEWYGVAKGTSTPLNQIIARGALGAQVDFWRQRMEGADIADVYYPAFLINGEEELQYPELKPGDRVRLRIIDGSASTSFWLTFGGETPTLISADGLNVQPVKRNKTFIAVAETYDFLVTIPEDGKLEFRITAQDGSGTASAFLGNGPVIEAPTIPRPDKIAMMKEMANMDMKMGAPALKANPGKDERFQLKEKYGMKMHGMDAMSHDDMKAENMDGMQHSTEPMQNMDAEHDMHTVDPDLEHNKVKDSIQHNAKHEDLAVIPKQKKMDHTNMHDHEKVDTVKAQKKDHNVTLQHKKVRDTVQHNKKHKDLPTIQYANQEMDHAKMHAPNKDKDIILEHEKVADTIEHNVKHELLPKEESQEKMTISDQDHDASNSSMNMKGMEMTSDFSYDHLRSPENTTYPADVPVTEILLNLTGNMSRYIWSMNGVPLSETDKIKIKSDEVTRITLNNLTMMHHPMHLHGHFFRVINKNGEYSPLKHTVNVPPMEEITIEFYGNEYGDWFFHCHILYHMMGGMARVMSYDTPRDKRMNEHPVSHLIQETNLFYTWGEVEAASHMAEFELVSSNIRNQFNLSGEYGWNENFEAEFSYEYYINDWFRVFAGVNVENELEDSLEEINTTAIGGIRYFTPYMFQMDLRLDNKLRPQISLSREIMIFPRTSLFGEFEYQADFGCVNDIPQADNFDKEITWNLGLEYMLSRNFSLTGGYDNRFGAGGGLSIRL